jgi:hypothetical protein
MPGPYKIAPLVAAGLAFLSTVSFAASPLAFAALRGLGKFKRLEVA